MGNGWDDLDLDGDGARFTTSISDTWQLAGQWFAPSVDYTLHLFRPAPAGWLLAHHQARHAGDGYASVELALWDPAGPHLVAYATQVMLFSFFDPDMTASGSS